MATLEPIPVPALSDNYIWFVRQPDDDRVIVVDPGEAGPVLTTLDARGLDVAGVLITHYHGDHVGGLAEVIAEYDVPVFGPATEHVDGVSHRVGGGSRVQIDGFDTAFDVLDTPGHTAGHITYHGGGIMLCGDTLFAGGCGRVFEGTNEQMHESLQLLARLPADTLGCCGHEYTLANLAFARAVEPDNDEITRRETEMKALRDAGEPTVPFTLATELRTNPFLRCGEPAVLAAAETYAGRSLAGEAEVFGVLRDWKNRF